MLGSFKRSNSTFGRAASSLAVCLLVLQAALPLVHLVHEAQCAASACDLPESANGSTFAEPASAVASTQPEHDSLLCLLCRAFSRQDGQGVLATVPASVAPAISNTPTLHNPLVVSSDPFGPIASRAPPADSA